MTVNVLDTAVSADYLSTRYTASVNATSSVVYGQTHNATHESVAWDYNDAVEISWTKFNGDETATVSIAKTSGSVTSAVVYPKNVATQLIVGGLLILTVPTNTRLHVEINGDRANAMLVFSQPTARAAPAGVVYWDEVGVKTVAVDSGTDTFSSFAHGLTNGQRVGFQTDGDYPTASGGDIAPHTHYYVANVTTDTFQLERTVGGGVINLSSDGTGTRQVYITGWTNAASPLSFVGFQEWHIGRLFTLADDVQVMVPPEAIVIGGFDLRGRNGVSIFGEGLLLGTFATHAELFNIVDFPTFASQLPYCMFLGYDGTTNRWDNEVQGVTIASLPFFVNFEGVAEWTNVQAINPWFYGTLTPQLSSASDALPAGQMTSCYCYSGDDVLTLGEQVGGFYAVVQDCFLVTSNNSCLHFGYWSGPDAGTFCFVSDCDMLHLGVADNGPGSTTFPTYGVNAIMKCWTDGYEGEDEYGRFDVFVQDSRVWGPHEARLLHMGNFAYPFTYYADESRDRKGQAARFTFARITVEEEPGQIMVIEGLDWRNTPHDIYFSDFTIGGVELSVANASDYLSVNSYPYRITFEGRAMVTNVEICNQALAAIGAKARVTSISPPDAGSTEAEQCSRYFNECLETLLEMFDWSFATKRVALTDAGDTDTTSWLFRYVVPADLCRAIAIIPEGAADDYMLYGERIPETFVREQDEDGTLRIYTNTENATLRYTAWVTNPNKWPPLFRQAFAALLASKIAGPLIRGEEGERTARRKLEEVEMYIGRAKVSDAVQARVRPEHRGATYQNNRSRGGLSRG